MSQRPFVGIPCDRKMLGVHPFHAVGEKYVKAVINGANGFPWLIPALGQTDEELDDIVSRLDGLLLTGSPSNIQPHHYKGGVVDPDDVCDPERDATTLKLIPKAMAAGIPILAICRGFQELNVVHGGSLHQKVHDQPGKMDHREDKKADVEVQYAPAHDLHIVEGGLLNKITGLTKARVNTVHGQGVNELGKDLIIEATAPDGLVEAFTSARAKEFLLAVQWHPEWKVTENPFYLAIFKAFGEACHKRVQARNQ